MSEFMWGALVGAVGAPFAYVGLKYCFNWVKDRLSQGGSMSMKQVLDKGLNKLISRKLLSWFTASTFLCLGFINNEQWTAITIGYVGIQGFADLAASWKHGK